MLKLFDPKTKVQKDRQIIRDTDMRMAKYSRRGIISNFLIYSLCLVLEGTFVQQHHTLAIVLSCGLFVVTVIRGYFLFRLEAIYPRGPAAWRTKYFLATLAGACWWGVILASITLYMDMRGEASLMWLYTVVFFSTTAHAFAPYKKFLSIYQFIGIVPAACCTFFIGEYIGPFYGFILLSFYIILNHHCSLMSQSYWERLEAQYTLAQKSVSLEEEKRDTRASVKLSNQYIQLLGEKIHSILSSPDNSAVDQEKLLNKLYLNVNEFKGILMKELELSPRLFNVRHLVQQQVHSAVDIAEAKGLELETLLSPALPSRMIGDADIISRIVSIMIDRSLKYGENCIFFMSVEFIREYEYSGELLISVSRLNPDSKRSIFQSHETLVIPSSLDIVLAKGLAETLQGSFKMDEKGDADGKYMHFRCPLKVAEPGARPEYHRLAYKGRPVLLVHSNIRWLNLKRLELEAMGFDVKVASEFKDAYYILKEALASGKMIQSVVYNASAKLNPPIQFCNDILEHNELKYTHQFVVCALSGQSIFKSKMVLPSTLIHFVEKPAGFFELEWSFNTVFDESISQASSSSEKTSPNIVTKVIDILWASPGGNFEQAERYITETVNVHCVAELKSITLALEKNTIQMIVVEYVDALSLQWVQHIRVEEIRLGRDTFIPVIGIGPTGEGTRMLKAGADHYFDQSTIVNGDVPSLTFWIKGGHH